MSGFFTFPKISFRSLSFSLKNIHPFIKTSFNQSHHDFFSKITLSFLLMVAQKMLKHDEIESESYEIVSLTFK